jgi:hypothetical protein
VNPDVFDILVPLLAAGLLVFCGVGLVAVFALIRWAVRQHHRSAALLDQSDSQARKADELLKKGTEVVARWEAVASRFEALATRLEQQNGDPSPRPDEGT